jgi:hypothetical protein
METTREGMSNTTGIKVGDEIYVQIYSTNSIPRTRKNREEKVWNPKTQNQKLITKYPAPKAPKRKQLPKQDIDLK